MTESLTFDSEAILAFFIGEEGGEQVRDILLKVQQGEIQGYLNIINLTEIYYIIFRVSPKLAEEKQKNLRLFGLKIIPIDDNGLWREAANAKCNHSLSLADAFAVATAEHFKTKLVVGSDEEFNNLNIQLLRVRA